MPGLALLHYRSQMQLQTEKCSGAGHRAVRTEGPTQALLLQKPWFTFLLNPKILPSMRTFSAIFRGQLTQPSAFKNSVRKNTGYVAVDAQCHGASPCPFVQGLGWVVWARKCH